MILNKFGNRIKEIRHSKSMSQDELAFQTGIDRGQISKIEKGKVNVTLETIEKLARALDVNLKDLMAIETYNPAHPFVKWAGGKTQLIAKLKELMPDNYENYFEPFVGGGALFFSIAPKKAYINDQNKELICAYNCFKDSTEFNKLKELLKIHEENNSEEYYYQVRSQDQEDDFKFKVNYDRAARMIYLNKACFNGLYRVNSKGFFNVPFGKKVKVNTYQEDNFNAIRQYFINNEIQIFNEDFQKMVEKAQSGDFVYFDPPYDGYTDKLGFVDYGKDGFGKEEQIRLRDCFRLLTRKGVKVMLSNHNTQFINELYQGYNIHVVNAKRMINSKADGRGNVQEVIVTNY